ncbi:unnamed protein product [Wickerhamomyces anomalus]
MISTFDDFIHNLFTNHQGWFLTALSSLMCIFGASIIYSDLLVKWVNPNSSFDIKSNERFLICGFSLSSGSLLFTSFFKLLPKGLEYFNNAAAGDNDDDGNSDSHGDLLKPSLSLLVYFLIGIIACELLNYGIHYFTSEITYHTHNHSHQYDEESLLSNDEPHYGSSGETNPLVVQQTTVIQPNHDHSQNQDATRPVIATRKSFFDIALNKITHRGSAQCIGIDDEDCEGDPNCINEELTTNVANDLHNLNFYRGLAISKSKNSLVAYTTSSPHHNVIDGALEHGDLVPIHPSNIRLTNEPNLDLHQQHKDDHHHQINTPISELLSIGLQTCLALTLHKFPEGFITYATSAADPKLGVSIFLSLAIHNIVEGFSMTLPLYLAFNSRLKAFGMTFILGGLSQPIGALLAYYLLAGREIDQKESFYIFGILMCITSGFLSVVSLQLFASSISFGGSANRVIRWCIVGIFIIQLSNVFTDYNN